MFSEFEFLINIPVLNTRYKHFRSQNNNLFHLFNNKLNYELANYFAEKKMTKYKLDKILSNLLIKRITKKLLYCNINE